MKTSKCLSNESCKYKYLVISYRGFKKIEGFGPSASSSKYGLTFFMSNTRVKKDKSCIF